MIKQTDNLVDNEIIKLVEGVFPYRTFKKRDYVNYMNITLKEGKILDKGARLSMLINYFKGGKWCYDCMLFTMTRDQCEILNPKDQFSFIYTFFLCPDCAELTLTHLATFN
uniref:Uncharacterized protein n=1 Tax=Meloidogyne enterolobii TaxID=390850 RepID=A0A6V7U806_MELEN|nr:unnamed protein product [Meloidogyne enterolobii]